MGGELNQFLSEALAEGGRLGAETALNRTNQQRELGIAIAKSLASQGQFNSLDPNLQQGFKKMLGETAFSGLGQLSDINSQLATLRQGAGDVLRAPVLEETTIQAPTPQVPQGVPDLGPLPEDVTPFAPRETVPQQVVQERAPTAAEQFERATQNAAAAQLIGGTEFANVILNEQQIKLEEVKVAAKTQLQADIGSRITDFLTQTDINSPKGDRIITGISVNQATGNINYNLGYRSDAEIRRTSIGQANQLIQQGRESGNATPLEVIVGLNAKADFQGTPADQEQILLNASNQIVGELTTAGVPIPQAIEEALRQTGTIPRQLDDLLPENVSNIFRQQVAKNTANLTVELSDLQRKATDLDIKNKAAEVQAVKIAENQVRPLTPKERETQIQTKDTIRQLGDLHQNFRAGLTGFARGNIPTNLLDVFGQLKEGEATFRAQTLTIQSSVIKAITGAQMNDSEARRILAAVPQLTDRPAVFLAKLELMQYNVSELQRVQDAIFENGGQRFGEARATQTVNINGTPVEVVAPTTGTPLPMDPVFGVDFNSKLEQRAGIAVMRDGSVVQVDRDDAGGISLDEKSQAIMDDFNKALAAMK